jgi:zinc protease
MENPRSRMSILGNYYTRKNEILDIENLKKEVKETKLEDINEFLKTRYTEKNITILGNIEGGKNV